MSAATTRRAPGRLRAALRRAAHAWRTRAHPGAGRCSLGLVLMIATADTLPRLDAVLVFALACVLAVWGGARLNRAVGA